jgi:CO/xanthine dehydrogenase Mo-binding subunit
MSHSTIGIDTAQVTALDKVVGRARYAGDLKFPGMLHAKVLRSPYAHARIVCIDTRAAKALPGVHLVLTGEDTPTRQWGIHRKEHRVLATGKVRFAGEEVVAVAAVDEGTARDALDLVRVEYEELPAVLDPDEALVAGAPEVHEGTGNLSHEIRIVRGDVDAAFAECAEAYEATYSTHSQYPGYLEPMATVAWMEADDRLTVWTSTQSVFMARQRMAEGLDMPASHIRVVQATTGGGFGGKTGVEDCNGLIAGFLATRTRRPVRLLNNRLEDFLACRSSVPERIWLWMGVDKNGLIVAKDYSIVAECGAYAGLAPDVMHVSAMRSDNLHHVRNIRSHARLVYTNHPPHGAFRGFGGAQMAFAVNSHMAVLAEKLGMDCLELHRRNSVHAGTTTVHGWKLGSCGLHECLDQVAQAMQWEARRKRPRSAGVHRRGVGIATAIHVSGNRSMGNWDGSTIVVKLNEDGRATVITGECDMGQGANTMLAQIVAHELGLALSHVKVAMPDTDAAPYCLGSFASRVTVIAGNAALRAAREVRQKLLVVAAEKLQAALEELEIFESTVRVRTAPERKATYAELCRLHIFRTNGAGLQVQATYDPPTVMADDNYYGNVAPAYSFAAQGVEVEVDTETGKVRVVDTFVSDDCGKALNPLAVHGQSCGAAVQAIGWTLYEELHYDNGSLMNGNFADYTMPTIDSVPMVRSGIVESNEPNGPLGAKGASETAIVPGAGAIANAVYDAVGVRINELPVTPEKVLAGLRALRGAGTEARHA